MFIILNNCRRCFYCSRVNVPVVSMSASWLRVSTYLNWNFGSRLILSNNQSRVTLSVRETYLIVRLLSLIIIFITASLSS